MATWHDAPVFLRVGLEPGHCVAGPALIIEPHQTVVVEPHWQAEVTAKNHLLLTRATKRETRTALGTNVDPVLLEVFNKRFTAIAEQMGYALQNTARSVNIKERLDFSCAIFDRRRTPRRQRAAYPGASRLDGPERRDNSARGRHRSQARRRVDAERSL